MQVRVHFYSYCKELAGIDSITEEIAVGSALGDLLQAVYVRFPKLATARGALLVAVGVEYQQPNYILRETDEVSLFPPVQGG